MSFSLNSCRFLLLCDNFIIFYVKVLFIKEFFSNCGFKSFDFLPKFQIPNAQNETTKPFSWCGARNIHSFWTDTTWPHRPIRKLWKWIGITSYCKTFHQLWSRGWKLLKYSISTKLLKYSISTNRTAKQVKLEGRGTLSGSEIDVEKRQDLRKKKAHTLEQETDCHQFSAWVIYGPHMNCWS